MRRVLTTSELYHVIYSRCIKGDSQKELRDFIHNKYGRNYDKAYISRIVNKLITTGYLICHNPRSRSRCYYATKKILTSKKISHLIKLEDIKSQRLHGICNIVQIQKSTFITQIKSGPYKNIKWDKVWSTNGLDHFLFSYPFENLGSVGFQRMTSMGTDQLKIILPRILWNKDDGNPKEFLRELADRVGTWFMKRFKIELVGLRICSKPHFAVVLTDPRLIKIAQEGTYRINDFMIDSSPPHNVPEIESEDYDLLDDLTKCPKKIMELEERLDKVVGMVDKLSVSIEKIDSNINNLSVKLDSLFQPSKPDSRKEEISRGVL